MPYIPEQMEKRTELEQNILKLLKPGIRLEDVADILDAKQFLRYQPGHGKISPGVDFDVAGFVDQELSKLKPINLPETIETTNDVIIPSDSRELLIGDKGGELEERKLIPRTRYLIELLTDMKLDYSVISGIVDKRMMRQNPYVAFVVPSIKKVVFVNNEEGNRTFIIHNAEPKDEEHFAGLTKDELKAEEPSAKVSHIVWPGNPGDWKAMVSEGLLKTPESFVLKARVEESEKKKELQVSPEGWMTNRGLAIKLNFDGKTVKSIANRYREANPEWFKLYLDYNNILREHYHPDLIVKIEQNLRRYEKPPFGWMTNNELTEDLGTSWGTIKKLADGFKKDHPDWFKLYLDSGSQSQIHYHPDLVAIIRQDLQNLTEKRKNIESAPLGWMNNFNLASALQMDRNKVKRIAEKYRDNHPKWFKQYLDDTLMPRMYYHPDLVEMIKQESKGYLEKRKQLESVPEGWMNNNNLAVMLGLNPRVVKRRAENYRDNHPEWFKEYLDYSFKSQAYYHPDLVERIKQDLKSQVEKRKISELAPAGWMTNHELAEVLDVNYNTVEKRQIAIGLVILNGLNYF